MLAVLYSSEKLPASIRLRNFLASLGANKTAILFINKEKYYMNLTYLEDSDLLDSTLSQMV